MINLLYAVAAVWLIFGALILWAVWPHLAEGGAITGYLFGIVMAFAWPAWLGLGIAGAWREERKHRLLKQPVKPIDRQDY